ncbi:hypothetical protein Taro_021471 [Colocasia esculenta]|uniref:GDSL esterase/lipase n=1 Tax=Colocasia esculenta TaxID=4460 RepID=A0A843V886_COLES|nr:hypothetical protein [Colocasia esculenta]
MALLVSIRSSISSLILAISLAAATIFPAHAAQNPPAIFVFGDSLSDVGTNNALPDGYHANHAHYGVDFPGGVATGRFTNGYNFIDGIAQHFGFEQSPPAFVPVSRGDNHVSKGVNFAHVSKGVNFASGGSGIMVECMDGTAKKCITMDKQIDNFKQVRTLLEQLLGSKYMNQLVSNSLFVFTCGSNDLNNFFDKYSCIFPFAPIDEYVANLTSAFNSQLRKLYELGGRKFAVINVPALGRIPTARALDVFNITGINFERVLNGYAQKFNKAEAAMLRELSSSTLPGMKYSIGNAYSVIMDVTNKPKKYGMKNVVDPCCGNVQFVPALPPVNITYCSPTAWLCSNRSEYAFWDNIHPTQPVIKYGGELFYSGVPPYATPINFKQLVGDDQTAPRRGASLRGVGSFEAM